MKNLTNSEEKAILYLIQEGFIQIEYNNKESQLYATGDFCRNGFNNVGVDIFEKYVGDKCGDCQDIMCGSCYSDYLFNDIIDKFEKLTNNELLIFMIKNNIKKHLIDLSVRGY